MTTTDALAELKQRGHTLTEDTLRGLIRRGIVKKPRRDSSMRFDWTDADIDTVCEKLEERATKQSA